MITVVPPEYLVTGVVSLSYSVVVSLVNVLASSSVLVVMEGVGVLLITYIRMIIESPTTQNISQRQLNLQEVESRQLC